MRTFFCSPLSTIHISCREIIKWASSCTSYREMRKLFVFDWRFWGSQALHGITKEMPRRWHQFHALFTYQKNAQVFFTHHKCSEEWWRLIPSVNQQMLLHSTNWTLTTICLLVSIWLEWDFIRSSQTCKRRLWLRRPSVLSTNHKVSGSIPGSSSLHVEVPLGKILNPNGMPHVKCINTL